MEWLKGQDKAPLPISLDPSRRSSWEQKAASSKTGPTAEQPASAPSEEPLTTTAVLEDSSSTQANRAATDVKTVDPTSSAPKRTDEEKAPSAALPPLEGDETYASTSYKGRIIAHHIGQQLEVHRNEGKKGPLMVGLQGPQGCGESPQDQNQFARSHSSRQNDSVSGHVDVPHRSPSESQARCIVS